MKCIDVIKAYSKALQKETGTQVIIVPSELNSEKFHISLSMLPHPVPVGNGRIRFRLRATVSAEIPASDMAINDCLDRSIRLALFFDNVQGFPVEDGKCGMAYHTKIKDEDDLFADLAAEERSYSYSESWLVELEINLDYIGEHLWT